MIRWIKGQFFHILPAILFFFIAFNLINMTEALMLQQESLSYGNMPTILLGAAIVAKVIVVIDNFPLIGRLPRRSLIANILWKSFLYGTTALIIRLATRAFPYLINSTDLRADYILFMTGVDWTRFWAIQIWFYALFFIFDFFRELAHAIGMKKVKNILLSRKS